RRPDAPGRRPRPASWAAAGRRGGAAPPPPAPRPGTGWSSPNHSREGARKRTRLAAADARFFRDRETCRVPSRLIADLRHPLSDVSPPICSKIGLRAYEALLRAAGSCRRRGALQGDKSVGGNHMRLRITFTISLAALAFALPARAQGPA